ncbi:hypothetical protein DIURU_005358 [Diutina rugosa]|uniref:DNA helicase n=1 Tax=Diutina rugosa TaxID=5481 RepID=A0A642UDE5_DIURU|nr:uncharacterized protein DIURU_005358 [Diutina rugosa]KAA8897125.1 hypothetical protein DIURU_005358 [Diutina rugosa]
MDDRYSKLEAKKEAIRQHPDFVLVRKRFPHAQESDIFRAFIAGKGKLRQITQILHDQFANGAVGGGMPMYQQPPPQPQQQQFYNGQFYPPQPQQPQQPYSPQMHHQPGQPPSFQPQMNQMNQQFPYQQPQPQMGFQNGNTNNFMPPYGGPQPMGQMGGASPSPSIDPSINPDLLESDAKRAKVMPMSSIPSTKVEVKKKQSILDKYKVRPQRLQGLQQNQFQQQYQHNQFQQVPQYAAPPGQMPGYPGPPQQFNQHQQPPFYPQGYNQQPPVHTKFAFKVNNGGHYPQGRRPDMPIVSRPDGSHLDILEERIRSNRSATKRRYSEDWSDDSDDSEGGGGGGKASYYDGVTSIDSQVLEYINSATLQQLIEVGGVEPAVGELVMQQRPFNTIYEISENEFTLPDETPKPPSRKGKRKPLGLRLVEATEHSLRGYQAVDSLVKQCAEYGEQISSQMKEWGVTVTGEGELSTIELDPVKESSSQTVPYIKHKPELLSEEITLNNYQQVGINWLNLLYQNHLSCILADEMGLGKTCQVISFMAHLKATEKKNGPHLVIVPASTIENWLREFQKFCPSLVVQAYYGSVKEREELRASLEGIDYDVMVTTYSLAAGAPADFKFLRQQNFNIIVYDEGHFLKNSLTERYNKLMRLNAKFRLLLTGTPLQNNLKELVSLLSFMLPKLFNEKKEDLQNLFNQKLGTAFSSKSQSGTPSSHNPLMATQAIAKAKTMMTPFVLRRKKEQVLQHLPSKCHEIIDCSMTESQQKIYDEEIDRAKKTRAERERRATITDKAELEKFKKDPLPSSTNVLMQLRKATLHPMLFRIDFTDDKLKEMAKAIMAEPEYVKANEDYIYEDMTVMSDYELNNLCEKFPTINSFKLPDSAYLNSGKVTELLKLLDDIINKRKEKVLVFSLFTQLLDVLEKVLAIYKYKFVRLDGATPVETRQDIIDSFYDEEDIPIFLLSTKAGGFGINLVAANNVVIFDQSFNPHDDKQAEDRAHRVGQKKEVTVYKLITKDTIEQNILHLAENKLQLDEQISSDSAVDPKLEEKQATMWEQMLFSTQGGVAV